jgi:hypothetical protein
MMAEELTENLTSSYSGFTNHPLIAQGCKHEYIWTKMDPAYEPHVLSESILNVRICLLTQKMFLDVFAFLVRRSCRSTRLNVFRTSARLLIFF